MTQDWIQHENTNKIILNLYAPFNIELKYIQQELTVVNGKYLHSKKVTEVKEMNKSI